jgi:hypothetical protein
VRHFITPSGATTRLGLARQNVPQGHRRLARGNAPGNSSKLSHASRKGRRNRSRKPQLGKPGEEGLAKAALAARSAPQRAVTAEPTPAVGKRSAARRVFAETGPHGVFKPARKPRSGRHIHRPSFIRLAAFRVLRGLTAFPRNRRGNQASAPRAAPVASLRILHSAFLPAPAENQPEFARNRARG